MFGTHWSALRDLLPAYQRIITVSVGNGRNTSFWHDTWLVDGPLALKMPALYSHFNGRLNSVHDIMALGVHNLLQQRLSTQASGEPQQLTNLLGDVILENVPDLRTSFYQHGDAKLLSSVIYRASTRADQPCPSFKFVWRHFAPPRVKFFARLLTKNRINCRAALVIKNILQDATCEICHQGHETADHIFSGCSFTRGFWARIGWNPDDIAPVSELWLTQPPPRIHADIANPTILLCCWEI